MIDNNKVALFDFCETLIKFQTADAFIDYVYSATQSKRMLRFEKCRLFVYKIQLPRVLNAKFRLWDRLSINKRWRIYELRGLDEQTINDLSYRFYVDRLRPNIIVPVLSEMKKKKKEGFYIGIVSGGFDTYIKYFAKDYGVDFLVSSKIKYKNHICMGVIDGPDCMGARKVEMLKDLFPTAPQSSWFYTDSISDLPLLLWVKNGVVVSKNKHQEWINKYNLNELLWE